MRQTQAIFMSNRDVTGQFSNNFNTFTTKAMIMKQVNEKANQKFSNKNSYRGIENIYQLKVGPQFSKGVNTLSGSSLLDDDFNLNKN